MSSKKNHDLSFLILRAFYDLRGLLDRLISEEGLQGVVRPGQGPLLYSLYDEDNCTASQLSERTGLALSTITNTLKRMSSDGLVSLGRDPSDGRVVRVRLTPRARRLESRLDGLRQRVREVVHAGMSEAQIAAMERGLRRVIDSMEFQACEPEEAEKEK